MEIEDEHVALQLDFAVAYKHRKFDHETDDSKLEAILSAIKPLGQAWGVQYKEVKKPTEEQSKALPDDLPVEEVLRMIGGKKTMVKEHGK